MPEAFEDGTHKEGVAIPASVMRARLPEVVELAIERERDIYGHERYEEDTKHVVKSFEDFVSLCEAKEEETGAPCRIIASY